MIKKTIPYLIIALVFIFPFRWAYLEYPDPVNSHGTFIDAGRTEYLFYFLLCIVGFLAFLVMNTDDSHSAKSKH